MLTDARASTLRRLVATSFAEGDSLQQIRRIATLVLCAVLAVGGHVLVIAGPASAGELGIAVTIQGSGKTEVVVGDVEDGASGTCDWFFIQDERAEGVCDRVRIHEEGHEAWAWVRATANPEPAGHWRFVRWEGCELLRKDDPTMCGLHSGVSGTVDARPKAVFEDVQAPTVSDVAWNIGLGGYQGSLGTVSYHFSTNEGRTECRLDQDASFSVCTSPVRRDYEAEGWRSIEVRAVDGSGQVSASKSRSVLLLDTKIVSGPSGTVSSPDATFELSSGMGTGYKCSLDLQAYTACAADGTVSYPGLQDGSHSLRVAATNREWQDATPAIRTWTVDTAAPQTSVNAWVVDGRTATFTFGAVGSAEGYECRLNQAGISGPWSTCGSPMAYPDLADGDYRFEVRAHDFAGNTDPTPAFHDFTVDTTPPATRFDSIDVTGRFASFAFSAAEESTFACRLGTLAAMPAWETCSSPKGYGPLPDGDYVFEARAQDVSGNVDPTADRIEFTVEATPPQTSIAAGPTQGSFALSSSALLRVSANEPGSTFSCFLNGAAKACVDGSASLTDLARRTHTFSAKATDRFGNTDATAAQRTWTVPLSNTDLGHSRGWARRTSAATYLGTYSQTHRKGATLSKKVAGARKVALVATRAPGHGKVSVYAGTRLLTTVDLAATTTRTKRVIPVGSFRTPYTGTLRLVVGSADKPVRIEGLGVATK